METRLNSLIYPIYGFIRSEFDDVDQMLMGEFRSGQQVKVGKCDWIIEIQKECSWSDNIDYLVPCLTCCSELSSPLLVSWNFQLISWKNGQKNHVSTPSSIIDYFCDGDGSTGKPNFLKWEEMLNGGWLKDGKIVVECAFRIDSEVKIPRRSIDFTGERPNSKDIEMICGVEDVLKWKSIEETIDISKIDEKGVFTETYFINGLPFKIELSKRKNTKNVAQLVIYSFLNWDDKSEWWRCETAYDISILNQNNMKDYKTGQVNSMFHKNSNNKEYHIFLNWDELIDPKNGYVKDGKIVIQASVQIKRQYGFDKKTGQGYVQPMRKMTDGVLDIENKRFHVSKKIISQQSSFIVKENNVLPVTVSKVATFISFLSLLHNQDCGKTVEIVESEEDEIEHFENVLKLAEKYGAPEVIERFDAVLKRKELADTMKVLELVDKYNLPELRKKCILKLKDEEILNSVINNPRYGTLNDSLKEAILKSRLVPELQTEEKEVTDYQFNTDFKKKSEFSDVEITVEGYKYYASKPILANASVFFMKRFYGLYSSDESQIKILKVSPLQFETLLTHIYHPTRPVTCASLDSLLSLSKQFSVQRLMDKCEEYLILDDTLPLIRKLEYAGKYELPLLLSACLKQTDEEPLDDQIGGLPAYVTDGALKRKTAKPRQVHSVIPHSVIVI